MVNYLIDTIGGEQVAVLSRGYGRKTKGTIEVLPSMTPSDCGDEPLLIKKNHPKTVVVVDENRSRGLEYLYAKHPTITKVILDDAMQHRRIKPTFTFLLTTWERPFFKDYLLPAGNLRDIKSRRRAADAIIISKTPQQGEEKYLKHARKLASKNNQPVFFSSIKYIDLLDEDGAVVDKKIPSKVVVVTGIASSKEFIDKVSSQYEVVKHFDYADHHEFSMDELHSLREFIDTFEPEKPPVITTEKDWQRLVKHKEVFSSHGIQVLHWRIEVDFGKNTKSIEELIRSI
jgi:tetraacyldisaccharide 4'-kinase